MSGSISNLVVWRIGSALQPINEVHLRRVTSGMGDHVRVQFPVWDIDLGECNQPPKSTQPGHPFVGRRRNVYQLNGGGALRLGNKIKGRYGSCVGGR